MRALCRMRTAGIINASIVRLGQLGMTTQAETATLRNAGPPVRMTRRPTGRQPSARVRLICLVPFIKLIIRQEGCFRNGSDSDVRRECREWVESGYSPAILPRVVEPPYLLGCI